MNERENTIWVERYRPKTIADCVLPKQLKAIFTGIVDAKNIPNMLLSGGPGTGKTTVAKAACLELGCSHLFLNSSDERGIDTIRYKIKNYASKMSFDGQRKVVILDEADNLTGDAQSALRSFIEEFSNNCTFILTCNFKNKIIQPLHSRCSVIEFKIPKAEKLEIAGEMVKRCYSILDKEGVKYNKKVVVESVKRHYPDFRRIINEMQKYANTNGEVDEGVLSSSSELNMVQLFEALKDKNYTQMRAWAIESLDNDITQVYRKIYDASWKYMKKDCIPVVVKILGDYLYKSSFSADNEVTLLACLSEIVIYGEFN